MKQLFALAFMFVMATVAMAQDAPVTSLIKIREMQVAAELNKVLEGVKTLNVTSNFCKVEILPCPDSLATSMIVAKLEVMDPEDGFKIECDDATPTMNVKFILPENPQTAYAGEVTVYLRKGLDLNIMATNGNTKVKNLSEANISVTSEKGKVNVEKSSGRFDIKTIGGIITLENVSGTISAESKNAAVTANSCEGKFVLDSGEGALTVNNFKGELATNSYGGKQTIDHSDGKFELKSKSGSIRLTYITADLIKAETLRGDITFGNSIKAALDISTGSGTIGGAQAIVLTGSSNFSSDTGRIKLKFANKKEELAFDVTSESKESAILVKGTSKKKKLQLGNGNIIVTSHSNRGDQVFS